jgi:hypothetical protein
MSTEGTGAVRCTVASCTATDATPCAYVDRRQRPCNTAWCAQHVVFVSGMPLCRRHAGVVRAIGTEPDRLLSLPDLENRAPSLVSWVAHDVDPAVREILQRYADSGTTIDESAIFPVGHASRRTWTRHWKVLSHTGFDVRISIVVAEAEDTMVRASVDGTVVSEAEPPWIARRRSGQQLSPEEDAAERAQFRRTIIDAIEAHLAHYSPGSGPGAGAEH